MLLLMLQDGCENPEFDDLVDRYERKVFNLIYRLIGDYDEAADLTQDTFVSAYKAFDQFRFESNSYTWLYRVAVNVCKNRFRERDRLHGVESMSLDNCEDSFAERFVEGGLSASIPTPETALERGELRRAVEDAIGRLPEDYRIVVVLRDVQGLSYREISETVDLSLDVVKTRLARAREMLRKMLSHKIF